MSSSDEAVKWLRAEIERDLAAARIINAGGFSPQRWDTEPPGQVNPADIPQSDAVTAALGCAPEYICGWVQVVAYDKFTDEPDEAYQRDSGAPFALVDNGRREVDHIIRNDPRNAVARCEAELAILDEHASDGYEADPECVRCAATHPDRCECGVLDGRHWRTAEDYPCRTVRLLASGYRHRPGYEEAGWKAWAVPGPPPPDR